MNRELLQQALEVLEDVFGKNKKDIPVITALKAALAAPQEAVDLRSLYVSDKTAGDWHRPFENYCAGYHKGRALAAPQEPVAWAMRRADGQVLDVICPDEHASHEGEYTMPLYAAPQATRTTQLSDDVIRSLVLSINGRPPTALQIARATEAHHGIGGAK